MDMLLMLPEHLAWLEGAGFAGADVFWARAGHALYGGYKAWAGATAAQLRRALLAGNTTPNDAALADERSGACEEDAMTSGERGAVIRPAEPGDWSGLWPLLQGMGQVTAEASTRERFGRVLRNPAEFLPVAELGGALVGYAWAHQGPVHLRTGRSTVRMNDLYVAPEQRRRGIGRLLVAAVIHWAIERRADWLEWQASEAAVPFYERLGYTGDPCPDPDHPFFEITLAPGQPQG